MFMKKIKNNILFLSIFVIFTLLLSSCYDIRKVNNQENQNKEEKQNIIEIQDNKIGKVNDNIWKEIGTKEEGKDENKMKEEKIIVKEIDKEEKEQKSDVYTASKNLISWIIKENKKVIQPIKLKKDNWDIKIKLINTNLRNNSKQIIETQKLIKKDLEKIIKINNEIEQLNKLYKEKKISKDKLTKEIEKRIWKVFEIKNDIIRKKTIITPLIENTSNNKISINKDVTLKKLDEEINNKINLINQEGENNILTYENKEVNNDIVSFINDKLKSFDKWNWNKKVENICNNLNQDNFVTLPLEWDFYIEDNKIINITDWCKIDNLSKKYGITYEIKIVKDTNQDIKGKIKYIIISGDKKALKNILSWKYLTEKYPDIVKTEIDSLKNQGIVNPMEIIRTIDDNDILKDFVF